MSRPLRSSGHSFIHSLKYLRCARLSARCWDMTIDGRDTDAPLGGRYPSGCGLEQSGCKHGPPVPWKSLRISRTPVGAGKSLTGKEPCGLPMQQGSERLGHMLQVTQWASEGVLRGQARGRPCLRLGPCGRLCRREGKPSGVRLMQGALPALWKVG